MELEETCDWCSYRKRADSYGKMGKCPSCSGTGFKPTDEGMKILSLIRHQLVRMLIDGGTVQDMIEKYHESEET